MAQTAMTVRMDNQQKEVKPQSSLLMRSMKKSEKSDDEEKNAMVYAVIDTNIFVSALITHNSNTSLKNRR